MFFALLFVFSPLLLHILVDGLIKTVQQKDCFVFTRYPDVQEDVGHGGQVELIRSVLITSEVFGRLLFGGNLRWYVGDKVMDCVLRSYSKYGSRVSDLYS